MKPKVKLRTLLGTALTILAFFSLPLIAVWKKSKVVDMSGANAKLVAIIEKAENRNIVLRYEMNRLSSRSRIETVARAELGLDYPKSDSIAILIRPSLPQQKRRFGGLMGGVAAFTR